MAADPRIGASHLGISSDGGRGAGGHCFIKDFAAFTEYIEKIEGSSLDLELFKTAEKKNIELLVKSDKDLNLLTSVYGENI
jgi:UDP-glucose 6-dehydrogenase